ncbi:hypothetical protein PhaeoP18_02715 [Phaeobacter piscinae]|uniref:Uncharacterized protein n=2 Tax=Phaeobacter piscinae TaxID=1580596 RepID=A0AAN1LBH2_9RHOB|nr:hypothetical protein [Phaeobacter piscinae]ATG44643.1 hypothetical protein PhaeoP13_02736 [Phaeobacter piscinae]AUR36957.1 hypothetical protein PhaeoP18_02715 [Phaeobacter piscinae]
MGLVAKVRLIFAGVSGLAGWILGGITGVAAFGTAVSGAFVFAPIAALVGFMIGPSLVDKFAKRFRARDRKNS